MRLSEDLDGDAASKDEQVEDQTSRSQSAGEVDVVKKKKRAEKAALFAVNPKDLEQSSQPRFLTSMEVIYSCRRMYPSSVNFKNFYWHAHELLWKQNASATHLLSISGEGAHETFVGERIRPVLSYLGHRASADGWINTP